VHENAQIIGAADGSKVPEAINKGPEVGRNDLCPCGSGKKFKKCGALNTEEHQRLMAGK